MNILLNPKYGIRNERSCSFICLRKSTLEDERNFVPTVSLIPPLFGFILSQFNGRDYDTTIDEISYKTNLKRELIKKFADKLIDNKKTLGIKIHGDYIKFPPHLLTNQNYNLMRENKIFYTPDFDPFNSFSPHRPTMPINVNLMITTKCKTDCIYCYADRHEKKDMSLSKIYDLLEECQKEGVMSVSLSGGDIFAYKNWKTVILKLFNLDYTTFISTKIPLTKDDVKFLKEHGIKKIQFSLDSVIPDELSKIINVGDNYLYKVNSMFDFCTKYGIKIIVKSVLTKYNSDTNHLLLLYKNLKNSAIEEWGVVPVFFSQYRGVYDDYRVSDENLKKIYDLLENLSLTSPFEIVTSKIRERISKQTSFKDISDFITHNKGCASLTYTMGINVYGKISACELFYNIKELQVGDLTNNTIKEIWNSCNICKYNGLNRKEIVNKEGNPCFTCNYYNTCKTKNIKRICLVDVVNTYGIDKWDYPDPHCPQAPKCNIDFLM